MTGEAWEPLPYRKGCNKQDQIFSCSECYDRTAYRDKFKADDSVLVLMEQRGQQLLSLNHLIIGELWASLYVGDDIHIFMFFSEMVPDKDILIPTG